MSGVIIEGWAAPFGGPAAGRDLQGEYFSARTDFGLERGTQPPLKFEHGLDAEIGHEQIGTVLEHRVTDLGLWVKAQLDRRSQYYQYIVSLMQKGALSFSSGAIPKLVKVGSNGEILQWPWLETSLTPWPANPVALAMLKTPSIAELRDIERTVKASRTSELRDIERSLRAARAADLRHIAHRVEAFRLAEQARSLGVRA